VRGICIFHKAVKNAKKGIVWTRIYADVVRRHVSSKLYGEDGSLLLSECGKQHIYHEVNEDREGKRKNFVVNSRKVSKCNNLILPFFASFAALRELF